MEHIATCPQKNFRKELNPKNFNKKKRHNLQFFSAYRGANLFSGGNS